ncbi:uncharacterized protein LOC103786269 isoform X2 [Pan paniscus]|uniref:uncharacterized protein LOC103786269 isoform X2 n=1 Tax=Pan paniscus TaxID=9597 RepID=UPI00155FCD53|nr:uncharacterized protein LOC103786269 isoform X2 [Pan paniscus]
MAALSALGHLTPGAVVIRRGEAGGARQQGWALAVSRRRERGRGARARARVRARRVASAARFLASGLAPRSCSASLGPPARPHSSALRCCPVHECCCCPAQVPSLQSAGVRVPGVFSTAACLIQAYQIYSIESPHSQI